MMKNNKTDEKNQGVISIFLALIFPVIFSLILVSVKSAVSASAAGYSKRIFSTAMESSLGDYYRPLYDEYHIFGLPVTMRDSVMDYSQLRNRMTESIEATLNTRGMYNAYPLITGEPSITSVTGMLDYDGNLFRKQIIDYAKYDEVAAFVEMLLDKCNLMNGQNESTKVLKEKMSLEEDLAVIDKNVIKLMGLIDGIMFDDNEVMTDRKGNVKTEDYFIKILQTGYCSASKTGINNPKVYAALKDKYTDPVYIMREISNAGSQCASIMRDAMKYDKTILDLNKKIEKEEEKLAELIEKNAPDKVIDMALERIEKLWEKLSEAEEKKAETEERAEEYRSDAIIMKNNLNTIHIRVKSKTEEALEIISQIRIEQQKLQPRVSEFGHTLETAAEIIDSDTLSELSKSFESMKKYVGLDCEQAEIEYDIDAMEQTLMLNLAIYNRIDEINFTGVMDEYSKSNEEKWTKDINSIIDLYNKLDYTGLNFDYSKLQFETKKNSLFSGFTDIIENGLYGLLIPEYEKTSEKEIMNGNLPSEWKGLTKDETAGNPAGEVEDKNGSELIASTEKSVDMGGLGELLKDSMINLAEKAIYLMYLNENFDNFLTKNRRADRPIEYELEYLVCGNSTDRENIESIAVRIMLLRLIVNVAHVFTDSTKTARANNFALSVVGFTGLPFLTAIVKYVVLFIWAFEQAVVETMALLLGQEVSLITTTETFCVRFEELLLINSQMVKEKAENLKKKGIALDYKDYINIFLILQGKSKQNYRTMDLIQSHLRYEYDIGFYFSNCIYGYSAEVEFSMPDKYPDFKKIHTGEVCYR